ncbi:HAD family hydrolase [Staphylococcus chromogenes]|uniref:HAD family hydrolase n=1 Tax=Staphylococcus chromogenes TaxID=46126 RepID=UPI000D041546|nr:HAD family hydrolase [Staphylococcus chromogenes]PTF58056.1 HAD family hydrolase [Staphylococcus chromogenes]PTF78829.1 HAD family hydrolase [Staphylococcus chromogenes]PTF91218.1 HAD family hydrolase [Staphylococcus chromogenes]PTG00244.1 HAD family hydrolase [Staphylococcus chromogenes]PTG44867.1 HAD family hydrolase [Staphylococcus chromogenes]
MYRAVIFDFDGTIIDTEQHLFDVINMHLEKAKEKPISIDFYRSNIGGRALALHHYLIEIFGEEKVAKIYQEHHEHARHLPLRQGVKTLMEQLHARHVPMAVATSSAREDIEPLIKRLGIGDYIQVIKGREDVEAVKPEPDLYLSAVQDLNFSPTHCLAIEDSVNGATAAITAGLDVIVNTNPMTEVSDFSSLELLAKDIDLTQVIDQFFNGVAQ